MEISTSTNILYERSDGSRIPVEESIHLCAKAGYRHMDFCFVDQIFGKTEFIGENWKRQVERYQRLSEQCAVVFTQSHGHIHDFCNDANPWNWELMCRCVEASSMLGVPWMAVHPSTLLTEDKNYRQTRQINLDYFRRLSDYAGQFGVGIAVENMWGKTKSGIPRYTIQPEDLIELVDGIDAENVGICWDTEHGGIEKINQGDAIRRIGGRLKSTHISDFTDYDNVHILPYTGFIDWEEIMQALIDAEYAGDFTYEIQHYLLTMPLAACQEAINLSLKVGECMVEKMKQKQ